MLGIEGDISPRPNGNGGFTATDSAQLKLFIAGLETPSIVPNEFQRTDVAPEETFGDGRLTATDQQQINNYIAGLDEPRQGGGPVMPIPPGTQIERPFWDIGKSSGRTYRIVSTTGTRNGYVVVAIELDSKGDETAITFGLNFDPAKLEFAAVSGTNTNPDVMAGPDAPMSMNGTVNATHAADGRLGLLLDAGEPFATGIRQVVYIRFRVRPDAAHGPTPITFDDETLVRSTSNIEAESLDAEYANGTVTITRSDAPKNVFSKVQAIGPLNEPEVTAQNLFLKQSVFTAPWNAWF